MADSVNVTWLFVLGWILVSCFVGAVGSVTRGLKGFFIWAVMSLCFTPVLALLGLIAVRVGDVAGAIRREGRS